MNKRIPNLWCSILEQILLSASNMLVSIVVVATAGVSWLGIYSLIFLLATFCCAVLSTLLHRQMVLETAALADDPRRDTLRSVVTCQALFLGIVSLVLFSIIALADSLVSDYRVELSAAVLYVITFSYYDLFRQYLYVGDRHPYALSRAILYVVVLLVGLGLVFSISRPEEIVSRVLLVMSAGFAASVISNDVCRRDLAGAGKSGSLALTRLISRYWQDGRYRLVGLVLTWAQNQSMVPFLMWLSGPLVAGYFSLARLLVMPMVTLNQGLITGTVPALRRAYIQGGNEALSHRISALIRQTLGLSTTYIALLYIGQVSGILQRFVPDYEQTRWFLLIWVATVLLSVIRSWKTQFFMVTMQFPFLMRLAFVSVTVTLMGMMIFGFGFELLYFSILFVAIGEIVSIVVLHSYQVKKVSSALPEVAKSRSGSE